MKLPQLVGALAALALSGPAAPVTASGAPTTASVRVEGRSATLFEGPVASEPHAVEASSDTAPRSCDGINPNDPGNVTPAATPTATTADAMSLLGQSFDGRWFGALQDYLITRWGSDAEGEGETWSLFVNNALSNVGGCQYQLHEGAETLWTLGFATARPLLTLAPEGTTAGTPPLVAHAELGQPFGVETFAYRPKAESSPPPLPERAGSNPFPGAKVAPVLTAADGSETVLVADPATVTTDGEARAAIVFATAGWHRIKAVAPGAVRSNRLDVCVGAEGAGCGPPPPEDLVRSTLPPAPSPPPGQAPPPPPGQPPAPGGSGGATTGAPSQAVAAARSSDRLLIDGLSLQPLDDRAASLHLRGPWRRRAEPGAWRGTVTIGARGARLRVRLRAGRPLVILRDVPSTATLAELVAGRRRLVRFGPLGRDAGQLLRLPRLSRTGTVEVRVLRGTVGVDGVAVES